jgi:hypothetical protein
LGVGDLPVRAEIGDGRDMGISDLESESAAPVASEARVPNRAMGLVVDVEFGRARDAMPFLADYFNSGDWLDRCEGMQIGLAMAGVDATIIPVRLGQFLEWSRLTRTPLDEQALDDFATLALAMRNASVTTVMAVVSEFEFATHSGRIAAFADYGDSRHWLRHREALRLKLEANGGRIEQLPIRVDAFVDWCVCLGQDTSEAALDRYAQLVLEHLTTLD